MKESDYHIDIPTKVVEYLNLKPNEPMNLIVEKDGISLEKADTAQSMSWDFSSLWSIVPTILTSIIFFIYFSLEKRSSIKLTGNHSIATATIVLGLISGTILFTIFLIKARKSSVNLTYRNIYWRNFPTIIISFAAILLIFLLGIFWVFVRVFMGVTFGIYTSTMIFLIFDLIINTFMINIADNITPTVLVDLLAVTIIGGLIISMLANSNRHWWRHNISFLGTAKATDSWQFNLTFIFAALLMVALVDYLFVSIKPLHRPKVPTFILRVLLTLMALDALGVGLIANNRKIPWMHVWHDRFAWAMAFDIIILIFSIKWLWPGISRRFLRASNLMGIMIIIASVLFKNIHYFSLTAYEIFASALAFSWIMMLFQYILKEINQGTHQFIVKVKINKPIK
ncbi:ABC transporter permease [Fructilactobacillus lindneri]|nr:DUF998 domain-containing protein [Fructilactobacillus lindneri]ANZ57792.1 ABC transporter permease [Fructilactobacillus lindneri]ANZ59061.1 ABC transporter permease [Fructilactobacillus lindneri]POG98114.1 ABC transporter permease [Fructilactobacillus lindneri]POH01771.1 ABC transporter permease [Fructilactobacillus lindneri]POH03615.1 ABC transporter permease [Fructilactobacillus lindneri]